jgi:hypothetical protein
MTARLLRWFVGLLCAGLILVTALPTLAAPTNGWLPFDGAATPAPPGLSVLASGSEAIQLLADLPGCMVSEVTAGDSAYSRLYGTGYGFSDKVGWPDLPVLRQPVEIPFGAQVTVELLQADYADYTLAELGLSPIYPVQPPLRKTQEAEANATLQVDEDFYANGSLYPSAPLALGEAYVVRGHRAVMVNVWPVAFDPSTGSVRLYRSITFRLRLKGSDMARTEILAQRYASPAFESSLAYQMLNYNQGRGAVSFAPDVSDGYLIITADAYYGNMLPFVSLKQSRGFEVTMTKTSEIPNGGTSAGIKAYIQTAYDTWPTPPSYVLLVGDTNTIPTYTGPVIGTSTDLYFGTMDGSGDWHPDLGRGRFPVRSSAQTDYMVNKYLAYANLTGQEPWIKTASFPATCDQYTVAEGTHNYVITNYTQPNGYTGTFPNSPQPGGDKLYCVTYGATHQDLVNAFNLGRWAIIYSGHGSYSGWEMSFVPADIQNLTAYGTFPFVASHACLSGDFGQTEVFGETWVLQQNKGALVYWGSSTYSYWDEDDVLERRMFDRFFTADPHPAVTEMTDFGLAGVEAAYPSSAQYYRETYNVLGDPGVKIFLEPDLPTFTLSVEPTQHDACTSGTVHSTAAIGSIMGFNSTVSLSTGTLPPGVSATFNPPSAPAPYTSDLALGVAAGTSSGDYPITVLATDNLLTLDEDVTLRVRTAAPSAPNLVSPADGATSQPFTPAFDWDATAWATSYRFQLDRSPLFTTPLFDVPGIADSGYTLGSPLDGGTCYWWRAQAQNVCGAGDWAAPFHFSTVALSLGFSDDMESGSGKWTHQAAQGTDLWAISTGQSHSPTHSWFVPDDSVVTDSRLWNTTAVSLGVGSTLTFWHQYQFEGTSYDGSVLEISTDGGQTWSDLGAHITTNGYNGTVSTCCSNPLGGRQAWTGDLTTWTHVTVDLSSFADQSAKIRWRLGCDSSVADTGWYIDDVQITSPQPPNPAPTLVSITPDNGSPAQDTPVQIAGTGFVGVPALRLGNTWLTDVVRVSPTEIGAVVPAGMAPGTYDLVLYNGDCQEATLASAFTVGAPTDTMHVHAVKMKYLDRGGGRYVVSATALILDQNNLRLPGATVTVDWTLPSGSQVTQSALTNSRGLAMFKVKSTTGGDIQVCVTAVIKSGYTYDPDQNRVTCQTLTLP